MGKYIRLCDRLATKGKLIDADKLDSYIEDLDREYYISTFYYNDEHLERFKSTGSVSGIKDTTTNKLYFDFDSVDEPDFARHDAITTIKRLEEYKINPNDIEIYFSGSKGFHLIINLDKEYSPREIEEISLKVAKDLKTFDLTMYDANQIMRLPGSKHPKTGLHKIPLTYNQLITLPPDKIKVLAKSLDNITETFNWPVVSPSKELFDIPKEEKKEIQLNYTLEQELARRPPQWKAYKWALLQGYFESGERNNALMVIAATCRAMGYDKETAYYMCKSAYKKMARRTGTEEFDKDELFKNIIEDTVFSDHWDGGQYSPKNNAWLRSYCERMGIPVDEAEPENEQFLSITDIYKQFDSFASNVDKNTIKLGIPQLDDRCKFLTTTVVGILGAPACVDEDTHIRFTTWTKDGRRQNCKGTSIKRLYESFHKIPRFGKGNNHKKATLNSDYYVSSMDDNGFFIRNKILDVVHSGTKPCFKLTTSNGQTITTTAEHKFYSNGEYKQLQDLKIGDVLSTHTNFQAPGKGTSKQNRYKEIMVKYHKDERFKTVQAKNTTHAYCRVRMSHVVFEASMNNMTTQKYITILNTSSREVIKELKSIPEGCHVHHINENHTDNRIENLMLIDSREHSRHHVNPDLVKFRVTHDTITSIEYVGDRNTYDIVCAFPYNNYVANDFVVHNSGKCMAKGTKVLMSNGTWKNIENIVVGDQIMGPDSSPRNILALGRGREQMVRISPLRGGEPFVTNVSHIHSFRYSDARYSDQILDMTMLEYTMLPKWKQGKLKLYHIGIELPEAQVPYNPYVIGAWLGDGTVGRPEITKDEPELDIYFEKWATSEGLIYSKYLQKNRCPKYTFTYGKGKPNHFGTYVRTLIVNGEKRIPQEYLLNSSTNRLRLLAGLMDTDGSLVKQGTNFCFTTKYDGLKEDVKYLSQSLGFFVSVSRIKRKIPATERVCFYWKLTIAGNIWKIPTKIKRKQAQDNIKVKDPLLTGFTYEFLSEDDYYGFEIDGDKRYIIQDFFVTHNTSIILKVLNNMSLSGEAAIFYSLDMAAQLITCKEIQMLTGIDADDILDSWQHKTDEEKQKYATLLEQNFKNVQFKFSSGCSVTQMKKDIMDYERSTGRKVRLVVVDYLEMLRDPRTSDPSVNGGLVASDLSDLAKETQTCVLLLLQPQKNLGDPSEPVLTYRKIKGSSQIEAVLRVVIGIYREGFNPTHFEDDRFMTINVLKNNMGKLSSTDCYWHGPTGTIRPIDEEGEQQLKELRALKKLEKETNKANKDWD